MLDVFIRKFKVVANQMNAIVDRNSNETVGDDTNVGGGAAASTVAATTRLTGTISIRTFCLHRKCCTCF